MIYVTDKSDYFSSKKARKKLSVYYFVFAAIAIGLFVSGVVVYGGGHKLVGWGLALFPLLAFLWYSVWFFDVKYPELKKTEKSLLRFLTRETSESFGVVSGISERETVYDGVLCRTVLISDKQGETFPVYIDFYHECLFRTGDSVKLVLWEKNVVAYEVER